MRSRELQQYLDGLETRGIRLWVEDDELFYEAPEGAMTDVDFSVLARNKQKIAKILNAPSRRRTESEGLEEPERMEKEFLSIVNEGQASEPPSEDLGELGDDLDEEDQAASNQEKEIEHSIRFISSRPNKGETLIYYEGSEPAHALLVDMVCYQCGRQNLYLIGTSSRKKHLFCHDCQSRFEIRMLIDEVVDETHSFF